MPEELADQPRKSIDWHYYFRLVRRRAWCFLIPFFAGWLALWTASWVLPAKYRSGTLILVEEPTVPQQFVMPNIASTIQDRLQSITQQILSRTRLIHIIEANGLYSENHERVTSDELVDKMRKDIQVEVARAEGNAERLTSFNVYYSSNNPVLAQRVTSQLTDLFISENLEIRQQQSKDTTKFLENQLEQAKEALSKQEEMVRQFKERHLGELPEQTQSNLQILSGLQAQRQSAEDNLSSAKQQNIYLESLLSQYRSQQRSTGTEGSRLADLPAIDQQLDKLRSQLADLSSHYTDRHPDVRKLKEEITKTEKLKQQLTADLNSGAEGLSLPGSTAAPDYGDANTPAVMQVQSQLKANQLEMTSRQRAIDDIDKQIKEYQGRLNQAPVSEQEFTDITRGYEQSKSSYDELLKKKNDSELATNLELRKQGEHFQILDPPSLPGKPYSPDRLKLCVMGLAIGLALGTACAIGFEYLDDCVYDEQELKKIVAAPVLVKIPTISSPAEDVKNRLQLTLLWAATALVFVSIAIGSVFSLLRG
jgi:polysaccharide chain length determinant protein (PEP-CTERM system associated)